MDGPEYDGQQWPEKYTDCVAPPFKPFFCRGECFLHFSEGFVRSSFLSFCHKQYTPFLRFEID
jgi:hypothetical protein